jgi:hypothetical protein
MKFSDENDFDEKNPEATFGALNGQVGIHIGDENVINGALRSLTVCVS